MNVPRPILILAIAGLVYVTGLHIPIPGIDMQLVEAASLRMDSRAMSSISIFALGVNPLLTAFTLAELVRLFVLRAKTFDGKRDRADVLITTFFNVFALAITVLQAYGVAAALSATDFVRDDIGNFTPVVAASFLGATAMLIFLCCRIQVQGLRNGFWPLFSITILLPLPSSVASSIDMMRTGVVSLADWAIVIVYMAFSVAAVVAAKFTWQSAWDVSSETAKVPVSFEPMAILIWPPVIALQVAGFLLTLLALVALDSLVNVKSYLALGVTVLAALLTPFFVFAYIRQAGFAASGPPHAFTIGWIISFIQMGLLIVGGLVNAFVPLPISLGAISIIVLTVTVLALRQDMASMTKNTQEAAIRTP